jgi:Autographiviridae endonuclease VII
MTVEPQALKTCPECGETKPREEFHKHAGHRDGLRKRCKQCVSNYARRWREANLERISTAAAEYRRANPDKCRVAQRRNGLKRNYGLTVDQYDALLTEQQGRCAICGGTEPGPNYARFVVDHCHRTGKVRGLLCALCNWGIGYLQDNPEIMTSATVYLRMWEALR